MDETGKGRRGRRLTVGPDLVRVVRQRDPLPVGTIQGFSARVAERLRELDLTTGDMAIVIGKSLPAVTRMLKSDVIEEMDARAVCGLLRWRYEDVVEPGEGEEVRRASTR